MLPRLATARLLPQTPHTRATDRASDQGSPRPTTSELETWCYGAVDVWHWGVGLPVALQCCTAFVQQSRWHCCLHRDGRGMLCVYCCVTACGKIFDSFERHSYICKACFDNDGCVVMCHVHKTREMGLTVGQTGWVLSAKKQESSAKMYLRPQFFPPAAGSLRRCAPRYFLKSTSIPCTFWEPDPPTSQGDATKPGALTTPAAQPCPLRRARARTRACQPARVGIAQRSMEDTCEVVSQGLHVVSACAQ